MATPHVSGVVALMLERNPNWGPRRVKDVLVSTSRPVGNESRSPYDQGAGLVNTTRAVDPGIVVDGATDDLTPASPGESRTTTYTVRNVGDEPRSLTVNASLFQVEGDRDAVDVRANRSTLELAPGERATVELRVDVGDSKGFYTNKQGECLGA